VNPSCRRPTIRAQRALPAAGFTLLELMVVMVVMAIVVSMVALSPSWSSARALDGAAERLSAMLEEARWQAISTGRRIAWEAPPANMPAGSAPAVASWYEQTGNGNWALRPGLFITPPLDGIAVTVDQSRVANSAGLPGRLILGPEPVGMPACILLSREGSMVAVVSDGVAPFFVQREDGCRPGAS
jgi:general secretion pathway protein H